MEDIFILSLFPIVILALALLGHYSKDKCKNCGRRGEDVCIKGGYYREYKCPRCGAIRKESGLDY